MPRTTATATPTEQPSYVLGAGDGAELLLPDGLSAVPEPVQTLNDEAVRLRDVALLARGRPRPRRGRRARSTRRPTVQRRQPVSHCRSGGQPPRPRRRSNWRSGGTRRHGRTRVIR